MVKAYILIEANPGATKTVYEALQKIEGVTECNEVMGPYDIVAEIQVENLADVPLLLSGRIRTIEGVESTTSLVTFPS